MVGELVSLLVNVSVAFISPAWPFGLKLKPIFFEPAGAIAPVGTPDTTEKCEASGPEIDAAVTFRFCVAPSLPIAKFKGAVILSATEPKFADPSELRFGSSVGATNGGVTSAQVEPVRISSISY